LDIPIIKIDLHVHKEPTKTKDCESVTVTGLGLFRRRKYRVHHEKNCKWTKVEFP